MSEQMVPVTIISTGTGDGATPIKSGTVAETPGPQPNVVFNVVRPIVAIAVRFGHTFLLTFSGAIGLSLTPMAGEVLPADLEQRLKYAAVLGLSAACAGLVKDLITIFGNLENRFPLMTGNV